MGILTGAAITAGFDVAALGMEFATIPEGDYHIGELEYSDDKPDALPERIVKIEEPIDFGTTLVTNAQYARGLAQLEDKDTVLIVQIPGGDRFKLIARGRSAEISNMSLSDIERTVKDSVTLADVRNMKGGSEVFDVNTMVRQVQQTGSVTLVHRLDEMREAFRGANEPVAEVSFWEAAAFAALFGLRLPTEFEWEAAARGKSFHSYGTSTGQLYAANGKKLAHFGEQSTADVKSYPPGEFGLYDMTGNVWEWTSSPVGEFFTGYNMLLLDAPPWRWRPGPYGDGQFRRVFRGGSWGIYSRQFLRAANRNAVVPDFRNGDIGFRWVAAQDSGKPL